MLTQKVGLLTLLTVFLLVIAVWKSGCYGLWEEKKREERGGDTGHKGERVCLCLCRSPQGDCGIAEVNESDWLVEFFCWFCGLHTRRASLFFISPSLASTQRGVKDRMADKACVQF